MDPIAHALHAVIAVRAGDHGAAEAHLAAAQRHSQGAPRRDRQVVEIAALAAAGDAARAAGLALEHCTEFPDDTALLARITHPAPPMPDRTGR